MYDSDPFEADLFKALCEYKVFSKLITYQYSFIDEMSKADLLFQRILKEYTVTKPTAITDA